MSVIKKVDVLLPSADTDLSKWAVVACDQFTSQPDYWESLKQYVGDAPSTLNMVFPEVYLQDRPQERIERINKAMRDYLAPKDYRELLGSVVLLSRDTEVSSERLGLVLAVDLEKFDFRPFTTAPIRATEGTVLDRIPPRLEIRKNALLEFPHIILLIDDEANSVIEPLYARRDELNKLYDFDLNMNGGHLTGYEVDDFERVETSLQALLAPDVQTAKYGKDAGFLFAVGDGNHSLVTAQKHWERVRATLSEAEYDTHPARYALVEVENLRSPSLMFEPIHRVVYGNLDGFFDKLQAACGGTGSVDIITTDGVKKLAVSDNNIMAISQIQAFIDTNLKENPDFCVDYIHGENYLRTVCDNLNGIGILMPTVEKDELFPFVLEHGVLPKKSFSMGEAEEKRYYLEFKGILEDALLSQETRRP